MTRQGYGIESISLLSVNKTAKTGKTFISWQIPKTKKEIAANSFITKPVGGFLL